MFQFSDNDIAIVQSLDHSTDGIAGRVAQSAQEGGAQSQEGTQAVRLCYIFPCFSRSKRSQPSILVVFLSFANFLPFILSPTKPCLGLLFTLFILLSLLKIWICRVQNNLTEEEKTEFEQVQRDIIRQRFWISILGKNNLEVFRQLEIEALKYAPKQVDFKIIFLEYVNSFRILLETWRITRTSSMQAFRAGRRSSPSMESRWVFRKWGC